MRTINLFQDHSGFVEGLEIQFKGEKVRDLSIIKIVFWNKGAFTIQQRDFSDADPLRLEIHRGKAEF